MTSRFDLSDHVVLVSGGAGLIGENVCLGLDEMGATVVVADVDSQRGREIAERLDEGIYQKIDITDSESIEDGCEAIKTKYDCIDGLVNAAYPRTESYGKEFEAVDISDWVENVTLHLGGYYAMIRTVALQMLEADNSGSIVNFGSIYGFQAPDFSVYNGTDMTSPVEYSGIKGAILNLTRYLASYLGPNGIRVNAVSPGGVFNNQSDRFVENYKQRVPLGRMAEPDDIVGAVGYLLSDAASYVTGHNLVIDGGWTVK